MNPSTLLAPHCSNNRCPDSFSFLNPLPLQTASRRQFRVSNSSQFLEETIPSSSFGIFGGKKELCGIQPLVRLMPLTLATSSAIAVAYSVRMQNPAALGGAAALAAASAAAVYFVDSSGAREVALVELKNYVSDDPHNLQKEKVESKFTRYGISKEDERIRAEL